MKVSVEVADVNVICGVETMPDLLPEPKRAHWLPAKAPLYCHPSLSASNVPLASCQLVPLPPTPSHSSNDS